MHLSRSITQFTSVFICGVVLSLPGAAVARLDEDTAQLLRRPDAVPVVADLDADVYRVIPTRKRARRPSAEVSPPAAAAVEGARTPAAEADSD